MDISIRLQLLDNASRGVLRAEEQLRRSQQRLSEASRRSGQEEARAATAAQQARARAFTQTESARAMLSMRSDHAIRREISLTQAAYNRLARSGLASANELARAQQLNIDRVRELREEMGEVARQDFGQTATQLAALAAGIAVAGKIVTIPVRDAATLQEAESELKMAMMLRGGKISPYYDAVMKQGVSLGNELPIDTAGAISAAVGLKSQGVPDSVIANGGLAAAARFGVVAKLDMGQAGEIVAKNREAYSLKDTELKDMGDILAQAHNTSGIGYQDFMGVASYAGTAYKLLGLGGIEDARKLIAMQSMGAAGGKDSTLYGTGINMLLSKINEIPKSLSGKDAADERAILNKHHIKLNFYDKKGNFSGLDNMLLQLDKLKSLSPNDLGTVMNKLFETQGGAIAGILMNQGGLKGMRQQMELASNNATVDDLIKQKTSTTLSKEDAALGTFTNTKAAIGKPTMDMWNAALDPINSALSSIQAYMANNPGMATRMLYGGSALAGAAVLSTATGQGQALIARAVPLLSTIVSKTVKGVGVGMLGEIGGNIGVDALTDKDTPANRYGHSIVTGASYGAGIGTAFGGIGAGPGAGFGALLGLMYETTMEIKKNGGFFNDLKPRPIEFEKAEIKPLEVKTQVNITLPPGMVVQSKSTTVSGGQAGPLVPKTGNVWDGAPK